MGQETGQDTSRGITLVCTKSLGVPRNLRRHGIAIPGFKELVKGLVSISVMVASMLGCCVQTVYRNADFY